MDLKHIEKASAILVRQAGTFIMDSWEKLFELHFKDTRDVFTQVDIESEKLLRDGLSKIIPEAGFIVEEGETKKQNTYNWTIDPIDGTKNYAYQLPLFYVQIALLENDIPILGQIYNPLANQFFSAVRGGGAYLNDEKIQIKERTADESIIDIDLGGNDLYFQENFQILHALAESFFRIRVTGGGYSIYLLTNALDGYISVNAKTKLVDQAPRILLMQEAGYRVEYVKRNEREIIVAGNNKIFDIMKMIVQKEYV